MDQQYNLKAVRDVIEQVFNRGNYSMIPEIFEPDFIEHQFGLHPTYAGMQGDIDWLRKTFPDFRLTIDDMAAVDDKVWVRMTARGTNSVGFMGPPNGRSFEVAVFDQLRFNERGKIVEHWGSPDRFAQLNQLGLLPSH